MLAYPTILYHHHRIPIPYFSPIPPPTLPPLRHNSRFGGYIVAGLKRKFLYLKEFSYCYYERQPLADSGAEPPANAPTILFIHGFTSNKTMWMVVTKYLPKTWRIIILDLPGHGESSFKPEADYSPDGMVEKLNDVSCVACGTAGVGFCVLHVSMVNVASIVAHRQYVTLL